MSGPIKDGFHYVLGGTLSLGEPSYVERQADRELLEHLRAGEYCYVLNSRQMGKSSLCVRTIAKLKEAGRRTAFLDLTKFGGRNLTAEQWYAALLSEVGRELGLRAEFLAHWKERQHLPPVQRLFSAISELGLTGDEPLTVFVDEIDITLSLPFSADEFFAAIRQLYVARATDEKLKKVNFCLLGTATPADLIQDTRVSPFNVGRRVELQDFTEAEAAPLAAGLGSPALLSRVLYWTGGHPYLTQRLCSAVQQAGVGDVDQACSQLFLSHSARESDDNLAFVRNRLLRSEVDLAALLSLYRSVRQGSRVPDEDTNPLCGILKLSGIAKSEGGRLSVRNRIYGEVFDGKWIDAHYPDAELRRQKAAAAKAAWRVGLIAVAVLAVVGFLALRNGQLADRLKKALVQAQAERDRATELNKDKGIALGLAEKKTLESQRKSAALAVEKSKAEKAAKAEAVQKGIAALQAKNAEIQANKAKAATLVAQAEKARAVGNEKEAKRLLRQSQFYTYTTAMMSVSLSAQKEEYWQIPKLLAQVRNLPDVGFEWKYWNRFMSQSLLDLEGTSLVSPQGTWIAHEILEWKPSAEARALYLNSVATDIYDSFSCTKVRRVPGSVVAFSPDDRYLLLILDKYSDPARSAFGGNHKGRTLKILDTRSGQIQTLQSFLDPESSYCCSFSRNGAHLALVADNTVTTWSLTPVAGAAISGISRSMERGQMELGLAVSDGGNRVAVARMPTQGNGAWSLGLLASDNHGALAVSKSRTYRDPAPNSIGFSGDASQVLLRDRSEHLRDDSETLQVHTTYRLLDSDSLEFVRAINGLKINDGEILDDSAGFVLSRDRLGRGGRTRTLVRRPSDPEHLLTYDGYVERICLSPDRGRMAIFPQNEPISVYRTDDWSRIAVLPFRIEDICGVSFREGGFQALTGRGAVRRYTTTQPVYENGGPAPGTLDYDVSLPSDSLPIFGAENSLVNVASGSRLAVQLGARDGRSELLSVFDVEESLNLKVGKVIAVNQEGDMICRADERERQQVLRVWSRGHWTRVALSQGIGNVAALTRNGDFLAVGGTLPGPVCLFNRRGKLLQTLGGQRNLIINDLAFSPGGERLAAIAGNGSELIVWDLRTFSAKVIQLPKIELRAPLLLRRTLYWPGPGEVMVLGLSRILTVKVDVGPTRDLGGLTNRDYVQCCQSTNGNTLAFKVGPQSIRVISFPRPFSPEVFLASVDTNLSDNPTKMAISNDGKLFGIADRRDVSIFSLPSGHLISRLRGHAAEIEGLAFSGDGSRCATSGVDNTTRIWDVKSGTEFGQIGVHGAPLAFIRSDSILVVGDQALLTCEAKGLTRPSLTDWRRRWSTQEVAKGNWQEGLRHLQSIDNRGELTFEDRATAIHLSVALNNLTVCRTWVEDLMSTRLGELSVLDQLQVAIAVRVLRDRAASAKRVYSELIASKPDYQLLFSTAVSPGALLLRMGRPMEAWELLSALLDGDQAYQRPLHLRYGALALLKLGRVDRASELCSKRCADKVIEPALLLECKILDREIRAAFRAKGIDMPEPKEEPEARKAG